MESVSLIIVNFNTESYVLETLRTLVSRPDDLPEQLIVIDNSPKNGLENLLREKNLPLDYYASSYNRGFAGGVNLGLKYIKGKFIILLNPDALPQEGCISGLIEALTTHENCAIAGPVLYSFEKEPQPLISATIAEPTLLTTLIEYTVLHRFFGKGWLKKNYFASPDGNHAFIDCTMVQGACFAIKKSWLDKVGSFDERAFFLYWEETDFCRRIRNHGGKVVYCVNLACQHHGGVSIRDGEQQIHYFWRSLYAYHRKHNGYLQALLMRILLIPGITGELLLLLLLNRIRRSSNSELEQNIERLQHLLLEQFH